MNTAMMDVAIKWKEKLSQSVIYFDCVTTEFIKSVKPSLEYYGARVARELTQPMVNFVITGKQCDPKFIGEKTRKWNNNSKFMSNSKQDQVDSALKLAYAHKNKMTIRNADYIENLMTQLENYFPIPTKRPLASYNKSTKAVNSKSLLQKPFDIKCMPGHFLKVEEPSGDYRPIILKNYNDQYTKKNAAFPVLDFSANPGRSGFRKFHERDFTDSERSEEPVININELPKHHTSLIPKHTPNYSKQLNRPNRPYESKTKAPFFMRPGFCELCVASYNCYQNHVKDPSHLQRSKQSYKSYCSQFTVPRKKISREIQFASTADKFLFAMEHLLIVLSQQLSKRSFLEAENTVKLLQKIEDGSITVSQLMMCFIQQATMMEIECSTVEHADGTRMQLLDILADDSLFLKYGTDQKPIETRQDEREEDSLESNKENIQIKLIEQESEFAPVKDTVMENPFVKPSPLQPRKGKDRVFDTKISKNVCNAVMVKYEDKSLKEQDLAIQGVIDEVGPVVNEVVKEPEIDAMVVGNGSHDGKVAEQVLEDLEKKAVVMRPVNKQEMDAMVVKSESDEGEQELEDLANREVLQEAADVMVVINEIDDGKLAGMEDVANREVFSGEAVKREAMEDVIVRDEKQVFQDLAMKDIIPETVKGREMNKLSVNNIIDGETPDKDVAVSSLQHSEEQHTINPQESIKKQEIMAEKTTELNIKKQIEDEIVQESKKRKESLQDYYKLVAGESNAKEDNETTNVDVEHILFSDNQHSALDSCHSGPLPSPAVSEHSEIDAKPSQRLDDVMNDTLQADSIFPPGVYSGKVDCHIRLPSRKRRKLSDDRIDSKSLYESPCKKLSAEQELASICNMMGWTM